MNWFTKIVESLPGPPDRLEIVRSRIKIEKMKYRRETARMFLAADMSRSNGAPPSIEHAIKLADAFISEIGKQEG